MSSDDWCVVGSDGTKEEGSSIRLDIRKRSYNIEWEITNGDALLVYIYTPRFAFIPGQSKTWKIGFCRSGDKADFTLEGHANSDGLTIDSFEVEIFDVRGLVRKGEGRNHTIRYKETVWCSFDGASVWLGDKIVVNIKMTVYGEIIDEYNYIDDTQCGDLDLKELREDYLRMMGDPLSNLTIHVGEKSFKAHKAVLRCRAPAFAQKYLNKRDGHSITIHDDIQPEVFRDVLEYIYTGDLSIDSLELRVLEIYKAAPMYGVSGLQRTCSTWIFKNVSETIVCDVWIVAEQFKALALKIAACTYMQQNMRKMELRDDFVSLVNNRDDFLPEVKRLASEFGNY